MLQALRKRLRCKEIWVEGAYRYRNPDEDLPVDFETNQEAYYQALKQPTDVESFIDTVQQDMRHCTDMTVEKQYVDTRSINWELIRRQYDEMIRYATALRLGTAETETILKRFTRDNLKHPTYQALMELGKAIKTIFLCRYLSSEALRRETEEG